jgi:hypothetical protein
VESRVSVPGHRVRFNLRRVVSNSREAGCQHMHLPVCADVLI